MCISPEPVADSLTLQLWRDGREAERGVAATKVARYLQYLHTISIMFDTISIISVIIKGSVNLTEYIGAELGFNLDKEANTLALVFR